MPDISDIHELLQSPNFFLTLPSPPPPLHIRTHICLTIVALHRNATRCKILQHTATHCNTLQGTVTHACITTVALHRTATRCNILQHTTIHCNTHLHHDHSTQHHQHPPSHPPLSYPYISCLFSGQDLFSAPHTTFVVR